MDSRNHPESMEYIYIYNMNEYEVVYRRVHDVHVDAETTHLLLPVIHHLDSFAGFRKIGGVL